MCFADVITIQRNFLRNIYEDSKNGTFVKCHACHREIGNYDKCREIVLLYDIRQCLLQHVSTNVSETKDGVPTVIIENHLTELEPPDELKVSMQRIFNSMVYSNFNQLPHNVQQNSANFKNEDFSLLCDEFMPKDGEFQCDVNASSIKCGSVDNIIDGVIAGNDLPKRSRLEFIPIDDLPVRSNDHDSIDFDMAILLPGEKMPVFKY